MMSKKKKDKPDESTKTKSKRSSKKATRANAIVIDGAPAAAIESPAPPAPRRSVSGKKRAAVLELSDDDIARRAYYISERRHQLNLPGDEIDDWVEAERQLRMEAGEKSA
jgi:Protein of unknown function (DUF2934)